MPACLDDRRQETTEELGRAIFAAAARITLGAMDDNDPCPKARDAPVD
jgi:hypothetical protein